MSDAISSTWRLPTTDGRESNTFSECEKRDLDNAAKEAAKEGRLIDILPPGALPSCEALV